MRKTNKDSIQSLQELKECQTSKSINSCFKCSEMFTCDLRKQYVKDVYLSMNPNMEDNKIGFEF